MAEYISTDHSSVNAPGSSNDDRIIPFSYTISGAIATGDTVKLCKYAAGYKPVAVHLKTSAAVATTGGSIKLGTNDGTTNDDDSLVTATTATSAVTYAATTPATPTRSVAETTVYATLTGTSGFTTGTTVSGFVAVTPFLA